MVHARQGASKPGGGRRWWAEFGGRVRTRCRHPMDSSRGGGRWSSQASYTTLWDTTTATRAKP
jgi:hypothetical protein